MLRGGDEVHFDEDEEVRDVDIQVGGEVVEDLICGVSVEGRGSCGEEFF